MLSKLLHPLLSLGGWQAYALVAALCFGEAAVMLGFVLPGETAVVLGGVLAYEGHVSLLWMTVIVVCCAIAGDSVGYEVGRHFGPRLLRLRLLQRPAVEKAQDFVRRRGMLAVFIGRFTAVFRALMPGIAGMTGLSYPRFLAANALGGIIWGIAFTFAGWAVGLSYQSVLRAASWVSYTIIGLVAVLIIVLSVRRRRRERREIAEYRASHGGDREPGELEEQGWDEPADPDYEPATTAGVDAANES